MESELSQKAEPSACLGVRHLFVFLGEQRLENIEKRQRDHVPFSRVPWVCQCVRYAGEPFCGHRLHVRGEEHGLGRVETRIYSR